MREMSIEWKKQYWLFLWLSLFVVASLIGCFDALGAYVAISPDETHALQRQKALIWNLVKWNLWVVIAPAVILLSHLLPLIRRNLIRNVSVHILCSICIALVHFALLVIIYSLITYRGDDTIGYLSNQFSDFTTIQFYVFISDFLVNILLYSLILISAYALEFYKQARAGQVLAAQLEAQLAQAQLQALKMQLQPHFLFNALHSISAQLREPEVARSMLARLGDFLRMTLTNVGAQEVTLKQEIEFLRCYLDIEQTRFHDRLTVKIEVEPEAWDARVPNLILQPLVENAIKHGFGPSVGQGQISVQALRQNGSLQVRIEDNGRGLQIQNSTESLDANLKEGIGLQTTRARLAQLYPESHRLTLQDALGGGLIVILEVPFNNNEEGS